MGKLNRLKENCEVFLGKTYRGRNTVCVTQDLINDFAGVTCEHQYIHLDSEKAKKTPYGQTIAHGY